MPSELWRAFAANAVRLHRWPDDDSAVVYEICSGDTHMVSPLGAGILELLDTEALELGQLVDAVKSSLADPSPENVAALVVAELERLHALRLVERSAP